MKVVTIDDIMAQGPCKGYPRSRIEELFSCRNSLTAAEVARLPIPFVDALWAIIECNMLPDSLLRLFACDCAERVLPLYEQKYPGDNRPRMAIKVARAFAAGWATAAELDAAGTSALDAARAAAGEAAWAAEREWQRKRLLQLIEEEQ